LASLGESSLGSSHSLFYHFFNTLTSCNSLTMFSAWRDILDSIFSTRVVEALTLALNPTISYLKS
jgi:hypothetical protein